jgi:hypothetical protein
VQVSCGEERKKTAMTTAIPRDMIKQRLFIRPYILNYREK